MGLLEQEFIWKDGSSIEISSMHINDGGSGASAITEVMEAHGRQRELLPQTSYVSPGRHQASI